MTRKHQAAINQSRKYKACPAGPAHSIRVGAAAAPWLKTLAEWAASGACWTPVLLQQQPLAQPGLPA